MPESLTWIGWRSLLNEVLSVRVRVVNGYAFGVVLQHNLSGARVSSSTSPHPPNCGIAPGSRPMIPPVSRPARTRVWCFSIVRTESSMVIHPVFCSIPRELLCTRTHELTPSPICQLFSTSRALLFTAPGRFSASGATRIKEIFSQRPGGFLNRLALPLNSFETEYLVYKTTSVDGLTGQSYGEPIK